MKNFPPIILFTAGLACFFLTKTSILRRWPTSAADRNLRSTSNNLLKEQQQQQYCKNKLDSLEETWDLRRQGRQNSIESWANGKRSDPSHVFDIFEPEAVCIDEERFGSDMANMGTGRYKAFGDGPKFVCGMNRIIEKAAAASSASSSTGEPDSDSGDCLIYSVGSNNQIDFEVAITETINNNMGNKNNTTQANNNINYTCEIHTFDPTIDPHDFIGDNYTIFHNWGFGEDGVKMNINHHERGKFEYTEMSVITAMKQLGHYQQNRTIDIFKIDCEGCEYKALTQAFNAIADGVIKIDQVQVEIHANWLALPDVRKLFDAADKANMRVFHKERNAWGCRGKGCVEYAFASNDFLRKANAHYVC